MYVSDIIGEEYKTWQNRDIILLTAPTGSGKTTFILEKLLPYAIDKGEKILYLVNRRVLKEQLSVEIDGKCSKLPVGKKLGLDSLDEYITITTYQSIEQEIKLNNPKNNNAIRWIDRYNYVVCDECHYFLNDSNFNTYTELSFDCIRTFFNSKIQIYMSATIDNTVDFIKERVSGFLCVDVHDVVFKNRYIKYDIPRDYEYVKLKYFNNQEELKQIIINNKDSTKWLIFTDSIASGKELENYLVEHLKNEGSHSNDIESQIGFIDADFDDDEKSQVVVDEINTKKMTSKRILIATAVIDNGISFIDCDLRNIVIMADTEESFVQMLGRKRPDGHDVTVYICKRDEGYFERRLQYIDSILKVYNDIYSAYKKMYIHTKSNGHFFPFHACVSLFINPHAQDSFKRPLLIYASEQSNVLEKTFSSISYYRYAKKICYPIQGCIAINAFAKKKYDLLNNFYSDIIEELQQDEDAFIRKQASWLGKDFLEIESTIIESTAELDEIYRDKIKTVINEYLDEDLDNNMRAEITKQLKNEFRYLLKKYTPANEKEKKHKKTIEGTLTKAQAIPRNSFNTIMELANLPYIMEKPKGSPFRISLKK